jgi:Gpi18-like mannosyltransferase
MAGAWQLALGFAVLGQLGTLYFILIKQRPFIAGCFFALAFGNRTEIILTAPLFMYLLLRDPAGPPNDFCQRWLRSVKFCSVPVGLGLLTLAYNAYTYGSPFSFPMYLTGSFSPAYFLHNVWYYGTALMVLYPLMPVGKMVLDRTRRIILRKLSRLRSALHLLSPG